MSRQKKEAINASKRHQSAATYDKTKDAINESRKSQRAASSEETKDAINEARRSNRKVSMEQHGVDFTLKTGEKLTQDSFHDFEQHPERSVLLFHHNSGIDKFSMVDNLFDSSLDPETVCNYRESLKKEILEEILTPEERNDILGKFLHSQGRAIPEGLQSEGQGTLFQENILEGLPDSTDAPILTCGACGIQSVQGRYGKFCTTVPLVNLPDTMVLNEQQMLDLNTLNEQPPLLLPIDENGTLKEFQPHQLRSTYKSDKLNKYFHLHPEFVHLAPIPNALSGETDVCRELTVLCPKCTEWYNSGKSLDCAPPNSIAAGIDFGNAARLPGLEMPSVSEMIVIARVRHFHNVVKLQSNHAVGGRSDLTKSQLRGHSVVFQHDAPIVASVAMLMQTAETNNRCCDTKSLKEALKDLFSKMLTIELLGPKYHKEKLAYKAKMQTILKVRPHVIYQWLSILQVCHKSYQNDPRLCNLSDFQSFKNTMDECSKQVFDNAVHVNDSRALLAEKILGDDVSQVRTKILDPTDLQELVQQKGADNHEQACKNATSMNLSYSYVAGGTNNIERVISNANSPKSQKMASYIDDIADAFNADNLHNLDKESGAFNKEDGLRSTREEEPMNEFEDMQELLVGAFPQVFMLGQTYESNSLLNNVQMEHLLMQYTNAAATCRELLFYLFDCKSRHNVIRNMAAKVRKDPAAFTTYAEMVRDSNFQQLIRDAKMDPLSDAASEVLRKVLPVLSFGARDNTMSGLVGDPQSLSHSLAMAKRYGNISSLFTATPDDVNNPTSLRLATKAINNHSIPATAPEEFFEKLQAGGTLYDQEGTVKLPLNYTQRFKTTTQNPVAVAYEFRSMMENICEILIGCPLDFQPGANSGQKRTWYFKSKATNSPRHKGIFGYVVAYFGCVETQARGALHFHLILWGGITPNLLEKAASFSDVCVTIQKALDSMYCAEIPRSVHARDILVEKMKETPEGSKSLPLIAKMYPSMKHVPSPHLVQKWKDHYCNCVLRTGIHRHSFTCKKPPAGQHRCRGARPAGNCPETLPTLLEVPEDVENCAPTRQGKEALSKVIPVKSNSSIQQMPDPKQRDYFKNPVPPLDEQLVVWELRRPLLEALPALPGEFMQAYEKASDCTSSLLLGEFIYWKLLSCWGRIIQFV